MKNKTIIISIMSEFHLQGAFSYIRKEHLMNENNTFFIISKYHNASSKFRVTEEDCVFLKDEKFYFFYDKDNKAIEIIKKTYGCNNLIYIRPMLLPLNIVPKLFIYNNFKPVRYVLIDEGLGTYRDAKFWWNTEIGGSNLNFQLKRYLKKIVEVIERFLFVKSINKHFLFMQDENKKLIPNENVVKAYRDFFEYQVRNKIRKEKSILFLSNFLSRLFIEKKDIIDVYKPFIKLIKEIYPCYKIYFKPHPIELEEFNKCQNLEGVEIIQEKISAEDLLNEYEYDYVIGFDSTALLSSALFFDSNVITMVNLLELEEIKESYREHLILFRDDISNIENIKEW